MYKVIKTFRDKHTLEVFNVGNLYETDDSNRAKELMRLGFLEKTEIEPANTDDSVLDSKVEKIKETVTAAMSKEKLEVLLKLEVEGKNRKTVVEHIESLLKGDDDESGEVE